jgi:hypothetical protein
MGQIRSSGKRDEGAKVKTHTQAKWEYINKMI